MSLQFSGLENTISKLWDEKDVFQRSLDESKHDPLFQFYEGPPFCTGKMHYGHIVGSFIKDTICRFATMNGYYVPRVQSWDTHGLPIEFAIEQKLGIKTKDEVLKLGLENYNKECKSIVMECAQDWEIMGKKLGKWIDHTNNYKTMDLEYMSKVWEVFHTIYEKNLIYEGVKVMPYSCAISTPISNFEASSNYQMKTDKTVIVKFPVSNEENTYFLAWTTTPWTLPAHYALCVHKDLVYCKILIHNEYYYVSKSRLDFVKEKSKIENFTVLNELSGLELVGKEYTVPYNFVKKDTYKVLEDDFVTNDSGTGIVHLAPAYGEEDYKVCIKNELITKDLQSLYIHIDQNGFGQNCVAFSGFTLKEMTKQVNKDLKTRNLVFADFDYTHSYPFCWRSDTPLIYKAVRSWFLNVETIKEKLMELNKTIHWIPSNIGSGRFHDWLKNTRDWCISRDRFWGTPIPIWKCKTSDEILVVKSLQHLEELTGKKFTDIHRDVIDSEVIVYNGKEYIRDNSVFDCWFESGSIPFAGPNTGVKADFISEGVDQTRGWFYTMLVIGYILTGKSPYENVIVNGLVLAEDGKKMSKRLKNYTDPSDVINKYGSDALRFYLLTSGASKAQELKFKESDVKEVVQSVIIPLYSSYNFFKEYYNFFVVNYPEVKLNFRTEISLNTLDIWIEQKSKECMEDIYNSLHSYNFQQLDKIIKQYIEKLNNNYIKLSRDNFKGKEGIDKQKMSIITLGKILFKLSIYISPILPFFSEFQYQYMRKLFDCSIDSVHLLKFKNFAMKTVDDIDTKSVDTMILIIEMIRKVRKHEAIPIKRPLQLVKVYVDNKESLDDLKECIIQECNLMNLEFCDWKAPSYCYHYKLNAKNIGKIFRTKKNTIETLLNNRTQTDLKMIKEDIETHITFSYDNLEYKYKDFMEVFEVLEISNALKNIEDVESKIVIEVDISYNEELESLFLAKIIASEFQKMRKAAGLHVYDKINLGILRNENENSVLTNVLLKNEDYIISITNYKIHILTEEPSVYTFKLSKEINNFEYTMFLY